MNWFQINLAFDEPNEYELKHLKHIWYSNLSIFEMHAWFYTLLWK